MLLFVSQDDGALELSKRILGGVADRRGEPSNSTNRIARSSNATVSPFLTLTQLKSSSGNAHSRAFDDINQVMAMVRERNAQTQASRSAQARARHGPKRSHFGRQSLPA